MFNLKKVLMKKITIILAITIMASNANAQWFLGGNFGINATVQEAPGIKNPYSYDNNKDYLVGLSVAPKMGYYFKEKLAFGIDLSIGVEFADTYLQIYSSYTNKYEWIHYEGTFLFWRFAPFLRYTVFNHKKFSLMLEGSLGVSGGHGDYSIIGIGIVNLTPVLSYSVTDKLQLEAVLGFLNLGYNLNITVAKQSTLKHDLNIGFNSKSVFVMSQLTIGMIYKFN